MLWIVLLIIVIFVVVQANKAPSTSATSTPGADEGVVQPVLPILSEEKKLKVQTMNNATVHHANNTTKIINLGTLIHSGEIKEFKMTSTAKEQGWGGLCSWYHLDVMRDGKSVIGLYKKLDRSKEYATKTFIKTNIPEGTFVKAGDTVELKIRGASPGCQIWIKDIVATIGVLA